jgi:hypothetical protein
MKPMIAYHGKPAIKAKYVKRMKAHIAADELIHGATEGKIKGDGFKGCAVTCCFEKYQHSLAPVEIGYPEQLSQLHDAIFEGLKAPADQKFALEFLSVVKEGADLSLVWSRFAIWLLADEKHGTRRFCDERGKAATDAVAALHQQRIDGSEPSAAAWAAASAAARDAASAAAWDAAWDAAWAAAWAAASAAASAAARDAAWDAAWDAHYVVMAAKLIELLRSAKNPRAAKVAKKKGRKQ